MDGNEALQQARARVIEAISQNMNLYGVTPSIGRLYCLLFFSDKPLTLDEMKEELGMSKASMSLAVRSLLDLNMVEKAWRKGVRKDLYVVKDDSFQRFFDLFMKKWRPAVSMNTKAIEKTIAELEELDENEAASDEDRERAKTDISKLQNWLVYYDWLDRLIDTFESKEILDFVPMEKKEKD
ncbi:GbsR/MarR family transcriptional regulator [Ornithinibacillus halophilus]|uniref:HTH-type transcriptional regulator n=1 Tax=Ornithinibacillus halophilus TaxID=930117 RepID=A0A1M5LCC4_9BACI|nr:GbsR/MarR family transcriptional regulator [Ornithinibacillus halophilus]SHG62063.1 DNA-binding transcriptional regulator GbsR, MarR family [Ornithinibacillus halophilus]